KSSSEQQEVVKTETLLLPGPGVLKEGEHLESVERFITRNYYIILDGSGSMGESRCSGSSTKIEVAKEAFHKFIGSIPNNANVGLAVFDREGLFERVALATENRTLLNEQVMAVTAGEGTPLREAILLGFQKLSAQAARQQGYGEYHLLLVTDGEANEGQDPTAVVDAILQGSPVVIHTIGFCIDENHSLNQKGRILYQSADSPEELQQGLQVVLAEAVEFQSQLQVDSFKQSSGNQ
ncbi:MAG: VWA domain-containing protein, partial [Oligoflexia bacterium]|nr:VWA domain-containing protein [Oligoflexia bacterium]